MHLRLMKWLIASERSDAGAIALRDKGLKFVAEQVANALDPKATAEFREMVELALMTTVAAAFGYAATKVSLASSIGQPVSPVARSRRPQDAHRDAAGVSARRSPGRAVTASIES